MTAFSLLWNHLAFRRYLTYFVQVSLLFQACFPCGLKQWIISSYKGTSNTCNHRCYLHCLLHRFAIIFMFLIDNVSIFLTGILYLLFPNGSLPAPPTVPFPISNSSFLSFTIAPFPILNGSLPLL